MSLSPKDRTCQHCGNRISLAQFRLQQCGNRQCKIERSKQIKREREKKKHANRLKLEKRERLAMNTARVLAEGEKFVSMVVPSNQRKLGKLPTERIEQFREHLDQIMSDSDSRQTDGQRKNVQTEKSESALELFPKLVEKSCSVCRGKCCQGGGTHAYLTPQKLGDIQRRFPEKSVEEIARMYLDRLPETSYEGACVFQGPTGCELNRELRSNTCNEFLCSSVRIIAARVNPMPNRTIVISAVSDDDVVERSDKFDFKALYLPDA